MRFGLLTGAQDQSTRSRAQRATIGMEVASPKPTDAHTTLPEPRSISRAVYAITTPSFVPLSRHGHDKLSPHKSFLAEINVPPRRKESN